MSKTILVVEDSPTIRKMLLQIFREAGYRVISAENGFSALGMVDAFSVDLVVTDMNMNMMSGLTFVKQLKERPKYADLPVVFVTTENSEELKRTGMERGATAWITKPFDPDELLQVVSGLCPMDASAVAG